MKELGKIKDACIVIAGQSPKGSSYNENGEGLEFHQGKKAFGVSIIEHSNVWTTEITKIAEPGDILMSVRAPVGPTNITDRKICIGRGLAAIRCNRDIIPQYILYALRNIESKIIGNDGAVFNSINKKQIEDLPLPILSLSEQQSIVDYLDSAFAKIDTMKANAEKALNEAKALFQASLKEMLEPKEGWEEKKLGEVCRIERGGSPRPIKAFITDAPNGLNWIKIGDTDPQGKYIYSTKEKIKREGLKKSRWVEENDFLLSNSMSFGRPYILKTNGCIHDGWLVLRDYQKSLFIDYFYYMLLSSIVQKQFKMKAQGSTVSNLNTDRVASVKISFPSLSDQQAIVSHLDSLSSTIRKLEELQQKTLAECDALKQAMLREVFE